MIGVLEASYFVDLFNTYFPPEWLRAALVLSIITTWVLIGPFAYLNQYTQRRYFNLWTVAWLFYALWLTSSINSLDSSESSLSAMLTQSCIGICALFLFWGNLIIQRHNLSQWSLVGAIFVVLLWSFVGAYQLNNPFWLKLPLFVMLGGASLYSAYLFFVRRLQRRYIGASVLSLGFLLWGFYLVAYPFINLKREFSSAGFLISASLQLIIAFGMIVLVLEEVRYESRTVRARLRQDVKRTRVLEKEVVATEDKYRNLFNNASDAIFIVDLNTLEILETNEAGCALVAKNTDQLVGKRFGDICPPIGIEQSVVAGDPGKFREVLESAEKLMFPRPDGTAAIAEGQAMPVRYADRDAMQVCLRDLSDRAKLEQRLRQAEKLSALGQLISGVAHELNNPLAIIVGRAELLMAKHDLDPRLKSDFALMNHESERASRIVQRLLAFARPQPPEKKYIQINDLFQQVVDLLKVDAKSRNIEIQLNPDPHLPKTMADAHQIEQVLMNLGQNAKHALLDKKDNSPKKLIFRTERNGVFIRMLVIDNGPGIAPQNLGKIFDPFFTTKPFGVGTGLGLSICYSILKEHGGNLFVQSEHGKGATFIMELPIVAEKAKPATMERRDPAKHGPPTEAARALDVSAAPQEKAPGGNGNGELRAGVSVDRKPRVLLVDDEPVIVGVLSELLTDSGFEIESATNGHQALTLLGARVFDLIISDLKMPGIDGRELYKKLREFHPDLCKRVIFLTGDTVSGDTRDFLGSLGTPWLSKPFNIVEVEETVRSSYERLGPFNPLPS